jgi:hypothetical protein
MLTGASGRRCSNATGGAASGAEVTKISRFIICSLAALWERMSKKISSLFVVPAIVKSTWVRRVQIRRQKRATIPVDDEQANL